MPTDLDGLTLALILTGGGVTATAALVTGLIGMLKKLPGLGSSINGGLEPAVAYVISAVLVVVAFVSQTHTAVVPEGFGAFLAWYGIANLSGTVHDVVKDVTTSTKRVVKRVPNPTP